MEDIIRNNASVLYDGVPTYIYWGLLILFCFGVLLFYCFFRSKRAFTWSVVLLAVEHFFLILSSTVIYRPHSSWKHNFTPFWSYKAFLEGEKELIVDNLFNVAVFIPLGILLSVIFERTKWWHITIIGLSLSVTIEALQFFLKRGFSELDDVIHNTLGCLMGYGLYKLTTLVYEKFSIRRLAVLWLFMQTKMRM